MSDKDQQLLDGIQLLYHGECQLIDWAESRTLGAYIKLRLPDASALDQFRGLDTATAKRTGHILHVTVALGDIAHAVAKGETTVSGDSGKGNYSASARRLRIHGMHPAVIEVLGSDESYLEYLRAQPCIVCGETTVNYETDEPAGDPCHVRRASNSGTGYKPQYFAVPMCHTHHQLQHTQGEVACYAAAGHRPDQLPRTGIDAAKEWFDKQAARHLADWAWLRLKEELGVNSMAEASPKLIQSWAGAAGVLEHMPQEIQAAWDSTA